MANDTVTMLGPDGGTYLVPKANKDVYLKAGMKTAPLAQQAMPPQTNLYMKMRQAHLRKQAPNLTPEAVGAANKTAAITAASMLPVGGAITGAATKGLPWVAGQAIERLPTAAAGYKGGARVAQDFGAPRWAGGAVGATTGFFAPELVKGAVNRAVPLVEKLGAAWRGEGAGASSLIRPGRGSAGDWASVPKENLWEYAVNPKYEGSEMQTAARRELERSGLSKTSGAPVATQAGKVAGVQEPLKSKVSNFASQERATAASGPSLAEMQQQTPEWFAQQQATETARLQGILRNPKATPEDINYAKMILGGGK